MSYAASFLARLLTVFGANIVVVALAFAGLAVVSHFTDAPMLILLFVVSLLQGGSMVRAFGPAVGSEQGLSLGGQIVGWIGFIGWLVVHLVNSGIVTLNSVSAAGWAVGIEAAAYLVVNTLVLIPFYREPIRERRRLREAALAVPDTSANQTRRDPDADRRAEQQRREAVRFACQMLYDRHRVELRGRFPPARLRDYFAQYLTDAHPADEVEQRGEQLQALIREFLETNGAPPAQFENLAQLDEDFRRKQDEIQQLDCTHEQRDALLSDLSYEKARAIRELRQS